MSRKYACAVLGVSEYATEEEVKSAYKYLVKQCHPDNGNNVNVAYYHQIVQAYEYLKNTPFSENQAVSYRDIGGNSNSVKYTNAYSKASEYARFEKQMQIQKEERKLAFEERLQREKEEYNRAMDAINAIRVAEAIKALLNDK